MSERDQRADRETGQAVGPAVEQEPDILAQGDP